MMNKTWTQANDWESSWWGDCLNTYGEEEKQMHYARCMGLTMFADGRSPYNIDLGGKSIIDVGGGPVSLLLKTINRGQCTIFDPLPVPDWVKARYQHANIKLVQLPAEHIRPTSGRWDEAWIYNCLQHTEDPRHIIENVRQVARIIRIYEWINTRINVGHPHAFTGDELDEWLDGEGKRGEIHSGSLQGQFYQGIFYGLSD